MKKYSPGGKTGKPEKNGVYKSGGFHRAADLILRNFFRAALSCRFSVETVVPVLFRVVFLRVVRFFVVRFLGDAFRVAILKNY